MLFLRWVLLLSLLAAAGSFALYALTGQAKYKRHGLVILKWTLVATAGFFLVLFVERIRA